MNGTVILDESVVIDTNEIVKAVTVNQEEERKILQALQHGWKQGQYSIIQFKNKAEKFLKQFHQTFILDYHSFC